MPLPAEENQINRLPIREDIFKKLLNWIMDGTLRPGEKIVDKELAKHMGVSRTPVREAIRRLEEKGLVESAPGRWTRVVEIPSTEPEMIYPIIWTLEKLAATIAIDLMNDEDFAKRDEANKEMQAALQSGDPEAAVKADQDLHAIFIERSQNFHLMDMLEDLKFRYRRLEINFFKGLSIAESSIEEHKTLISAFRAKDVEMVKKAIKSNWEKNLKRFRKIEKKALQA